LTFGCPARKYIVNTVRQIIELVWNLTGKKPAFELKDGVTAQSIEESFEDPFAVKLLPDGSRFSVQARFFNLGMTPDGLGVFSLYRTNGKQVRVIHARAFETEEYFFYQRKLNQSLST
jgi:hypothetical protein